MEYYRIIALGLLIGACIFLIYCFHKVTKTGEDSLKHIREMERALKREEDLKRVRDIHSALTDQLNKMKVEADAILENLGNMKTRLEDVIEYPKMLKTRKEYLEQKENGNHINPKQPK